MESPRQYRRMAPQKAIVAFPDMTKECATRCFLNACVVTECGRWIRLNRSGFQGRQQGRTILIAQGAQMCAPAKQYGRPRETILAGGGVAHGCDVEANLGAFDSGRLGVVLTTVSLWRGRSEQRGQNEAPSGAPGSRRGTIARSGRRRGRRVAPNG